MSWFKYMSEDFILDQLNHQADGLAGTVKSVNSIQKAKIESTKVFLDLAKNKQDSRAESSKIVKRIDQQQAHLKTAMKTMERIKHYLDLLVQMEQASLAIHNKKSQDDLSKMIDVFQITLDKFEHEREQVRLLENSLNILNVELQKQEDYLRNFDTSKMADEEFLTHIDEYEDKLSESDIVKVSELKSFCNDLNKMINGRRDSRVERLTESDLAAQAIKDEMLSLKMHRRAFFPVNAYGFLHSIVRRSIKTRNMDKLALFLITFLLSRLKKYKKESYLSQLRASILTYNLLEHKDFDDEMRDAIVGAAMLANLHDLDFPEEEMNKDEDEPKVIKQYYRTANSILAEEFPFINNLIRLHRRIEVDDPLVPWVVDGSRLLGMIFDLDRELQKAGFLKGNLDEQAVKTRLKKRYAKLKEVDGSIKYLLDNWSRLIPKTLM